MSAVTRGALLNARTRSRPIGGALGLNVECIRLPRRGDIVEDESIVSRAMLTPAIWLPGDAKRSLASPG